MCALLYRRRSTIEVNSIEVNGNLATSNLSPLDGARFIGDRYRPALVEEMVAVIPSLHCQGGIVYAHIGERILHCSASGVLGKTQEIDLVPDLQGKRVCCHVNPFNFMECVEGGLVMVDMGGFEPPTSAL